MKYMKLILAFLQMVVCLFSASMGEGETNKKDTTLFGNGQVEMGLYGGFFSANKEIGRGINATGGEPLIATLKDDAIIGVKIGGHGNLLGFDINIFGTTRQIEVRNDRGVSFPDHGENIFGLLGDILLYPFRQSLLDGKARPYVTTGLGFTYLSIDLDNIDGKESYFPFTYSIGAGIKFKSVDLQFKSYQVSDHGSVNDFDMQSFTIGVSYSY